MTLDELLAQEPSVDIWEKIIAEGKRRIRLQYDTEWNEYNELVAKAVISWPPEIERKVPDSWPNDLIKALAHRPHETDLYNHFIAKVCSHPDLRLSDGSQAVWLERRFVGGAVEIGSVKAAIGLLWSGLKASSATQFASRVKEAIRLLQGGVRTVGTVGCADTTGGVTICTWKCHSCCAKLEANYCRKCDNESNKLIKHEYRLELEIKVGNAKQKPEQLARMASVRSRGGCYIVANSVDEAVKQIKQFIHSVS